MALAVDTLFKHKKLNKPRLLAYGFVKNPVGWVYATHLLNGQFGLAVTVVANGKVTAQVVDAASGEEYILHKVSAAYGAFVGQVKEEYEAVLHDISAKCFDRDVYKGALTKLVIEYVREKYDGELEYLWERTPANSIWRRKDNAKWYGALLVISKEKLGLKSKQAVEIIDLRIDPTKVETVVDGQRYFPGYHMNKQHWITICLDGSVPINEVYKRIDASYALAEKK